MKRSRLCPGLWFVCALLLDIHDADAQGYRLRLDSRIQSVAYRGFTLDSVAVTDVSVGTTGGFVTSDGIAVRCGGEFCTFWRPGAVRRSGPSVTTADLSAWGFGVPGLRLRTSARLATQFGSDDVWPGMDPPVQLDEGVIEYSSRGFSVQVGRTHVVTQLGFSGFDGFAVSLRNVGGGFGGSFYGGWGLAQGVDLPSTSKSLNPLNDFLPSERQLLAGGELTFEDTGIRARGSYLREVDPRVDNFVSERVAGALTLRIVEDVTVSGEADYDIAAGWWGSAEGLLTFTRLEGRITGSLGVRRYRPHFDLWTIWGAFSPVPYRAFYAATTVEPLRGLTVRARWETYEFSPSETSTPLSPVEDDGWRWAAGWSYGRAGLWSVRGDFHREVGPGAASVGAELGGTITPSSKLSFEIRSGILQRPLEFRFNDARVWTVGLDARLQASERASLTVGATLYRETRRRPDQAQFDWNQLRLTARVTLHFSSVQRRSGLHPAILQIPDRARPL